MMVVRNGRQVGVWAVTALAAFVSVVSAGATIVIWGARMDTRVSALAADNVEIHTTLSKIDAAGTRNIPIVQEKLNALERMDAVNVTRIDGVASRLDTFISQVQRLDTPLSKKVEGLEIAFGTLRDAYNIYTASSLARAEVSSKRIDVLNDRLTAIDHELNALRQRISAVEGDIKILSERLANAAEQRNALNARVSDLERRRAPR